MLFVFYVEIMLFFFKNSLKSLYEPMTTLFAKTYTDKIKQKIKTKFMNVLAAHRTYVKPLPDF